ncbi:MAG: protein kinase [Planctomycetaceae bacterium]|nr:protein kinase [Planctomycetaceae bacterium]
MTCPRIEELSDFALGKLGEQSLDAVAGHLDECPQCQETVARLSSDDTFVAKLKGLPAAPEPTESLSPAVQAPGWSGVGQRSTGPAQLGIIGACQAASQRGVMNVSLADFMACVVDLECVSSAELSTLVASLPADKREDSQELARSLVQTQKVTKFQATLLLKGQGKSLLMGDYVVLDRIGAGGMGQVFRARHRRMDRIVALKVISSKALAKPDVVQRFQREVKAAARLIHPHIVTAFDAGEQNGVPYLVMELVEGPDLATVLKKQGLLPVGKTLELVQQAARGLAFAHAKGVVHRDVKPGNLLVGRDGVKILDMGLARFDDVNASAEQRAAAELTQDGDVMGTIDYMAPEQVVNTRNADAKSDVYSLGCTLFRLLTGKQLFTGQTLMECIMAHREQSAPAASTHRPEIPPAVDQLIQRMVAKRPEERPTMTEVVTAIDQLRLGMPVVLTPAAGAAPLPVAAPQPTMTAQPVAIPQASAIPTAVSNPFESAIPLTKSNAGKPPKRGSNLKWIAAAAGFLLVAFGVVVVIRDKDGNKLAEVNVPEGGAVTIESNPETKSPPVEKAPAESSPSPAPAQPAPMPVQPMPVPTVSTATSSIPNAGDSSTTVADVERRATLWAQAKGAKIELWVGDEVVHLYSRTPPTNAFQVRSLDFAESLDPNKEGRRTITDDMLQNLVGLERIVKLRLPYTRMTDQGLAVLGSLKTLETLDLTESAITDAGLAKLHNLKLLKSLNLSATQVTTAGVAQLRAAIPLCKITPDALGGTTPAASPMPNVSVPPTVIPAQLIETNYATERKVAEWVFTVDGSIGVEANGVAFNKLKSVAELPAGNFVVKQISFYQKPKVGDVDWVNLRGLSRLNDLNLLGTATTDQGLIHLANLTSLEKLDLQHTQITGSGVQQLSRLTSLTTLRLSSCPITDAGISTFPAFPSLTDFEMYRTSFSRLDCIRGMPKLQYVNIGDTPVRDLSPLADKSEMRKLNLWKTGVTDASLIHLKSLTKLKELQLNETAVTDAGLPQLESLPELVILDLNKTPATAAGVQQFKQKRPGCEITWSPGTPAPITVKVEPTPGGFFGEASPNTPLGGTADTRDPNRPRVDPPAADKLAEATKTVRELFKAEFAKKKPEDQRVLLTLLLGQGGATKDDLVGRFALLLEARNIAAELADVAGMTNAVASASDLHKIDEAEWLADGVDLALKKPITSLNAKTLTKYLDERVTRALNTDNFTGGKRLLDLAIAASRKAQDAALTKSMVERGKSFDAQKKAFEAIEKARATLTTSPADTAANLAMGKYWCFVTGEWPLGLAALAKCDDAQIVELAQASLADPQTPAEQVALADQWWSKADKKTALTKFELQFAAVHWYQLAQGQADGLLKAKIEKRLTEAQEAIKVISRDARPERAAESTTTASSTPTAPATPTPTPMPVTTPATAPKAPIPQVPAIPANVKLLTPREIAAKVNAAGGRVMFTVGDGPEQTLTKIEDWPAAGEVHIVLIDLITAPNFSDLDLVSMTDLSRLKRLTLQRSQITEASLPYLKKLPLLAFLDLGRNARLGDAGWEHVGEMKQVTTISLIENRFTDVGLLKLKGLTDLKSINLSNTLVTDRGMTIVSGMKGLTFVNLDTCAVTDATVDLLAGCPLITNLLIAKTQITDRCAPKLAQLKSLRDLNVRQTRLSGTAVEGLRRELPVAKVTY